MLKQSETEYKEAEELTLYFW